MNNNRKSILSEARRSLTDPNNMYIGITGLPNGEVIYKSSSEDNITNIAILETQLIQLVIDQKGLSGLVSVDSLDFDKVSETIIDGIGNEIGAALRRKSIIKIDVKHE